MDLDARVTPPYNATPMKIALIRKNMAAIGGAESYLSLLVAGLLDRGHEIHLITAKEPKEPDGRLQIHKVHVYRGLSALVDWSFARGVSHILGEASFDTIMSLDRTIGQDIYRAGDGCHREWLRLKGLSQNPLKNIWEWINPLNHVLLNIERQIFDPVGKTQIIANSDMVKRNVTNHYGVPPERIHTIINGVDLERFDAKTREAKASTINDQFIIHQNTLCFCFVGNGFKRKGLLNALEGLSLLNNRVTGDFKLFVLGKDNPRGVMPIVENQNLRLQVRFVGEVDPVPYYHRCHMMIFPTWYDPCSNACLEAMASGCAVLTTRLNGAAEHITHGESGYIIDRPDDHEAMFSALKDCVEKVIPNNQAFVQPSRDAVSHLSSANNIEKTLSLIESIKR